MAVNYEDLIKDIEGSVVKREESKVEDIDKYKKAFVNICETMIKAKNPKKHFNSDAVGEEIDFLIKWTFGLASKDIDVNKGFLFKGDTGKGKSFLLRAWIQYLRTGDISFNQNNEKKPLAPTLVNVKRISGEYQDKENGGYKVIIRYSKVNCLILDDIGTEPETSKIYGNGVNVIEEIINLREENDMITFATTNIEKFSELYDSRTIRRINVLFQAIPFKHKLNF